MSQLVDKLADLTALRDREALDIALVKTIHELLPVRTAAIYRVVGNAGNERWLKSAHMAADQPTPTFDLAWSKLDTLPRLAEYPLREQSLTSRKMLRAADPPGCTVFALTSNPSSLGILEIDSSAELSEDALRLINGVLRLYQNFQGLLDYGERDALTELLNRKTFDGAFLKATLAQEMALDDDEDDRRHTIQASSYWLGMIDIDHFKRVNDNFGHLIGDEVLLLLARLMRTCFRFHDQLYRFGGEEFVVLMRCRGDVEAANALDRLRVATENHLFPQVGHITISIGFSEVRIGDTPSGAFERADKALYHAKSHGRNQVISYAALIASGELTEQEANVGDMELF